MKKQQQTARATESAKTDHEWHELRPEPDCQMPSGSHKKMRLYADRCIPHQVIDELRNVSFDVQWAAEDSATSLPDNTVYAIARKRNRVLLTMDDHFWNDRKHPLQKGPGVIFVDVPPNEPDRAIKALAIAHSLFAKAWPGDWWPQVKMRAHDEGFTIRLRTWDGNIAEDEFRLAPGGTILTRRMR